MENFLFKNVFLLKVNMNNVRGGKYENFLLKIIMKYFIYNHLHYCFKHSKLFCSKLIQNNFKYSNNLRVKFFII